MIVVADAGPLLHLFWIDGASWALPPQSIEVVQAVWDEVRSHAPGALQDPRLRHVAEPITPSPVLSAWNLDDGEMAALTYALSFQQSDQVLVLCDEQMARRACLAIGLTVVGSIGLIIEAFRASRVPLATAETALRELPGRGRLHVRPQLIEVALADLSTGL
jgi:predicted nucleic acid-binding protein